MGADRTSASVRSGLDVRRRPSRLVSNSTALRLADVASDVDVLPLCRVCLLRVLELFDFSVVRVV
jgi:hypothetical protein